MYSQKQFCRSSSAEQLIKFDSAILHEMTVRKASLNIDVLRRGYIGVKYDNIFISSPNQLMPVLKISHFSHMFYSPRSKALVLSVLHWSFAVPVSIFT
jgi:hypothetical protein